MGEEKKGKALAMELIDDLLNDKTEEVAKPQAAKAPPSAPKQPDTEGDSTERINDSTIDQPPPKTPEQKPPEEDKVRASVGRSSSMRAGGQGTEAALAQSESLRIAQGRILDLENEIERLRTQNEELGADAETLRRRADELLAI